MTERPTAHPLPATDVADLLGRLQALDPNALSELYDRYGGYVFAIALRMLEGREEAEEATQDVFWQLWKGRIHYDPERGRFSTWLYAIARSRCLDRLRKRRVDDPRAVAEPDARATMDDPERLAFREERRLRVQRALASLPEDQRRAIELCFFEGLTHHEIAERLQHPLGTVKSRIRMAMGKLRSSLGSAS